MIMINIMIYCKILLCSPIIVEQIEHNQTHKTSLATPIAILIGFGMIAGAIFYTNQSKNIVTAPTPGNEETQQQEQVPSGDPGAINPITADDHIRGNPNAPIMLVEYSDFECPFCKRFHGTLNQIMEKYGLDGQVAWVYRQFPIKPLHPNAPQIALASECVADLGGNEAFWKFADKVFGEREINEPTDITRLSEFAVAAGVPETEFNTCLSSDRLLGKVEEDFNNAAAIGAGGTPHTIVLVGDQQGVINGAQDYKNVEQYIENLLTQLQGGQVEN